MTRHTLFPGYIRLAYSGVNQPHHMTLPVKPDGSVVPGTEPTLQKTGGGTASMTVAVDDLLSILLPLFADDTTFSTAEYFEFPDEETGSIFVFGINLIEAVGTNIGTRVEFGQATLSFKTALGNTMKAVILESTQPIDQKVGAGVLAAALADWRDYYLSDDSVIWGRDGERAIFAVNFTTKENDTLRAQAGL